MKSFEVMLLSARNLESSVASKDDPLVIVGRNAEMGWLPCLVEHAHSCTERRWSASSVYPEIVNWARWMHLN
jgi:hypothetical protein